MKDRIKKIRKELNLTQQEFADRLGIKRGAIANYEIGRNEPVDSVISLLCREFHVNEEWLRSGTGEMFIEKSTFSLDEFADTNHLTDLEKEIVRNFMSLDEQTRNAIYSIFSKAAPNVNVPNENVVEDAEAAYIKSRSDSVQKTELSVSNTVSDTKEKKEA